jgi:hypothetical protein
MESTREQINDFLKINFANEINGSAQVGCLENCDNKILLNNMIKSLMGFDATSLNGNLSSKKYDDFGLLNTFSSSDEEQISSCSGNLQVSENKSNENINKFYSKNFNLDLLQNLNDTNNGQSNNRNENFTYNLNELNVSMSN